MLTGKVSASQLESWIFDPQSLSASPKRSLGKSVHLNLPGKKQNSGFGLPPIAVTNINNNEMQPFYLSFLKFKNRLCPFSSAKFNRNLHDMLNHQLFLIKYVGEEQKV